MKKVFLISVFALVLSAGTLSDKCTKCHGADGGTAAFNGKSKVIKDMAKGDFFAALKGYKDGSYGAGMKAVMAGIVKPLSDADLQQITDDFYK